MFSAQIADNFKRNVFNVELRQLPYQIWHVPGYMCSTGETELGIVFCDRVPTQEEEPELYALGRVERVNGDVAIRPCSGLVIWLSTVESDAVILREHPDWAEHELFRYRVTGTDELELITL